MNTFLPKRFFFSFQCLITPIFREIAEEEVQHLFASADDDQDNLLSFQEVLDNHEIFVGSEATDYGEHLHNIHTFIDELWTSTDRQYKNTPTREYGYRFLDFTQEGSTTDVYFQC